MKPPILPPSVTDHTSVTIRLRQRQTTRHTASSSYCVGTPRTYRHRVAFSVRNSVRNRGCSPLVSSLLLTNGSRWLMPRMYCSHIGLLYYPQTFQLSPLVSFCEVLAARGGDVHEPSYFRMFQLSPLVVFKRS